MLRALNSPSHLTLKQACDIGIVTPTLQVSQDTQLGIGELHMYSGLSVNQAVCALRYIPQKTKSVAMSRREPRSLDSQIER